MGSSAKNTVHASAVRYAATKTSVQHPQVAALTFRTLDWMKKGIYPRHHIDSIVQLSRGSFDIYDAWVMAQVDVLFFGGRLAICAIPLGEKPAADRMLEENRRRLVALPEMFRVELVPGKADEDGYLSWDGDLQFSACRDFEAEFKTIGGGHSVLLEIGTTEASRSLLHIEQDGGLARWPYGHDFVYVYLKL